MVSFSFLAHVMVFMAAAMAMPLVGAKRDPLYMFNTDALDVLCTDSEWNVVLQTMHNATALNRRRQQRRLGWSSSREERELQTCPRWCGKYCAAMGVGCVQIGRRRKLSNNNGTNNCNGNSKHCLDGDVTACAADIAVIDAALSNVTAVSDSCQALLDGDKTISCPDFTTTDCYIRSFSLWSTEESDTAPVAIIPKMNATGTSFCKKSKIALRVETNFVVGKVTMAMYFTKSLIVPMKLDKTYEEMASPYYVFGSKPQKLKDGTMGIKVEGKKLPEGWYTLTAVSADNPNQQHPKSVSFAVTDC
jgi:hypothetical protein